ncbi:glycoside hydrolase domain-containing protein [Actinopolyspora mortivallis]|uniref:glycoside hydrolase domain-containing protein n=1 Tax=Actinopolyspora mortivallis TaxID=33906 RepID=UPI00036EC9C1
MADEMVRRAQRFVNRTYGGVSGVPNLTEDGITGWNTMNALTRALQHEVGMTHLADEFNPVTLASLEQKYPSIDADVTVPANVIRILQSGLYCKGYDGGGIDGKFNDRVSSSVTDIKSDMGVASVYPGDAVMPKVFKGILNMDAYVTVNGGTAEVREIQRWLNGRYTRRAGFFISPCDGRYTRDTAIAMMVAIQYESGLPDEKVDGLYGPTTRDELKKHELSTGSTGPWVRLFTALLICNQRGGAVFTDTFGSRESKITRNFQEFVKLSVTGTGNYRTWASLLVSTGDPDRRGSACDGVTEITPERARALKDAGYEYIGRYLYNPSTTSLPEKQIQPGELDTIARYGLRCFPIYQTYGRGAVYFDRARGQEDAYSAVYWARHHGFKPGTRIYFAVDFDVLDHEVTSNIIPHFRGINEVIWRNSGYKVGIYGPRNVCSRVSAEGLSTASFVSGMSTAFSGNLGYPLPRDWSFDQIATVTIGSGEGEIEIDNNIASGRDEGQGSFDPSYPDGKPDVPFDFADKTAMLKDMRAYLESIGVPETGGEGWDDDWATLGSNSNTDSFNKVLEHDELFTSLARTLNIRKALVQAPVLWEIRQWNPTDKAKDEAVINGVSDDSSTGLGQIFGKTAIEAWNYCVDAGIVNGSKLSKEKDLKGVWTKLRTDERYNIRFAAYVLFHSAHLKNLDRPTLTTSDCDTKKILARYNGTGDNAQQYGCDVLGVYKVFEKYYSIQRA